MGLLVSRKDLVTRIDEGFNADFLFFWRPKPVTHKPLGPFILSQWYEHPFTHEGDLYRSAEHLMMVKKAELFGDLKTAEKIRAALTPREAKALGREVQNFTEEVWVKHRTRIVEQVSMAKFGSDDNLTEYLLSTGNQVLVEASPHDQVWGIGLHQAHVDARIPKRWRGLNLLGFALMKTRRQLNNLKRP